mmetsp:Transcript_20125/g.35356  ORF Transcript_20125/g.35356 Transcript_20125/m.35356 type:complete len:262 (+) Transcript_20125:231-1016(+)
MLLLVTVSTRFSAIIRTIVSCLHVVCLQLLLFFFCEPTRPGGQVEALLPRAALHGLRQRGQVRPAHRELHLLVEEAHEPAHVPVEQLVRVGVAGRDHLGEIDQGDGARLLVDHEVELVVVAVDEPVAGQLLEDLHALRKHRFRVRHLPLPDLVHGVAGDHAHGHAVPVGVQRDGRAEAAPVQRLHERVLLEGGEARHVQPVALLAPAQVVPVLLHRPETGAAQPVQLQHQPLPGGALGHVDVRFLAHPDLVAHRCDHVPCK